MMLLLSWRPGRNAFVGIMGLQAATPEDFVMTDRHRGRHQSTDKTGKKTIARLESIPGVTAVVIGRSYGGKSIARGRAVGDFKLQGEVPAGFKGVLQTSRGIQEIFIRIPENKEQVARVIREIFP
ncbi:MAG: hypothetical protein V3S89_12195 [Desulfobacterales bacterium]